MRILGITIPNEKRVDIGLTVLFGIGRSMSTKILNTAKVSPEKKVSDLTEKEENDIRKIVEAMNIEGNLKREIREEKILEWKISWRKIWKLVFKDGGSAIGLRRGVLLSLFCDSLFLLFCPYGKIGRAHV